MATAWDCKRAYDYVRPVTAVHFLFAGKKIRAWAGPYRGTRVIDGADWEPYQPVTFVTPPFPEFTSGHRTAKALAEYVRDERLRRGETPFELGKRLLNPRHFELRHGARPRRFCRTGNAFLSEPSNQGRPLRCHSVAERKGPGQIPRRWLSDD